jgi:hypothetical protein
MTTLPEIETAVDALPPKQQEELLLFLAVRLRSQRVQLPEPRKFSAADRKHGLGKSAADVVGDG